MKKVMFFIFVLVFCLVTPNAHAALVTLSTHSSNGGSSPPDPSLLDATLDFSVVGNILTLNVHNLTPESGSDPALKINEIYFSATENVTDLALYSVTDPIAGEVYNQWKKSDFVENGFLVDGFGLFDVAVIDGVGNRPHVIDPGETLVFKFTIDGTGSYSDTDFTTEWSSDGEPMLAAAKFYDGGDIGGYGATNVPEPATICLLSIGAFGLLRSRRSKL